MARRRLRADGPHDAYGRTPPTMRLRADGAHDAAVVRGQGDHLDHVARLRCMDNLPVARINADVS